MGARVAKRLLDRVGRDDLGGAILEGCFERRWITNPPTCILPRNEGGTDVAGERISTRKPL
jgi:hypothetical protein